MIAKLKIKKRRIWALHSTMGLVAGLGLLVIGLSGSILMFSDEIDGWLRPEIARVSPPAHADRLPMNELLAQVALSFPDYRRMGWEPVPAGSTESDTVWVKRQGDHDWLSARIDPYTGNILSPPSKTSSHFTGWVLDLHYAFLVSHTGMFITSIFAIALIFLGISGLFLYRGFFRHFFRLRWRSSARILLSDFHKFVGINSVVFNLILGFTGAWWNLEHVIGHLIEEPPPASQVELNPPPLEEWASIEGMLAESQNYIEGFQANYLGFPQTPDDSLYLYGRRKKDGPLRGDYGSTLEFDAKTGAIRKHLGVHEKSIWKRLYDSFEPLHYGTFGGLPIRILWAIGGLTPGTLAVSGSMIWWRRRKRAGKRAYEVGLRVS